MKTRGALALLALAVAFFVSAPAARAADDPNSFDDPGVHFKPPEGWERLPIAQPQDPGAAGNEGRPLAVWAFHKGQGDQRVISLSIKSYDGDLDGLERSHESEMRNGTDGLFVDKRESTKLANGMPAYWLRTSEGSDIGKYYRRYEWIVWDGQRSVILTLVGRQGDFDDKFAKDAMSSLYVVAYPRRRA